MKDLMLHRLALSKTPLLNRSELYRLAVGNPECLQLIFSWKSWIQPHPACPAFFHSNDQVG